MRVGAALPTIAIALLVAACGAVAPSPTTPSSTQADPSPRIATTVHAAFQLRQMTYTVSPWPLDATTAFLCLDRPGPEFTEANPRPPAGARCVQLATTSVADVLTARLESERLDPATLAAFGSNDGRWYLAIAGSRGSLSAARVIEVIDSPIPSDPGPS